MHAGWKIVRRDLRHPTIYFLLSFDFPNSINTFVVFFLMYLPHLFTKLALATERVLKWTRSIPS